VVGLVGSYSGFLSPLAVKTVIADVIDDSILLNAFFSTALLWPLGLVGGSKKEKEIPVVITFPVSPSKASGGKSGRGKCLRNIIILCDTR